VHSGAQQRSHPVVSAGNDKALHQSLLREQLANARGPCLKDKAAHKVAFFVPGPPPVSLARTCRACDKTEDEPKTFRLCSRCKNALYCSKGAPCFVARELLRFARVSRLAECQVADWKQHRTSCVGLSNGICACCEHNDRKQTEGQGGAGADADAERDAEAKADAGGDAAEWKDDSSAAEAAGDSSEVELTADCAAGAEAEASGSAGSAAGDYDEVD
jgi:hypothetical protein